MTLAHSPSRAFLGSLGLHCGLICGLLVVQVLDRDRRRERPPITVTLASPARSKSVVAPHTPAPSRVTSAPKADPKKDAGLSRLLKLASRPEGGGLKGSVKVARGAKMDVSAFRSKKSVGQNWSRQRTQFNARALLSELNDASPGQQGRVFAWESLELSGQNSEQADEDFNDVVALLGKNQARFRECYERALFLDSKLQGKAELVMGVASSGRLGDLRVAFDRQKGAAPGSVAGLQDCLRGVLDRITFPKIVAGRSLKISLLFTK